MNGAAVVENELPNAKGAGAGESKALAPNEKADGLATEKLMSEADADSPTVLLVFDLAACSFALIDLRFSWYLTSANAVDTTRSPRKAA